MTFRSDLQYVALAFGKKTWIPRKIFQVNWELEC